MDNLCAAGLITTSRVREVFLATDRALYVPCQEGSPTEASSSSPHRRRRSKTYKYGPYADAPQSIGSKVRAQLAKGGRIPQPLAASCYKRGS